MRLVAVDDLDALALPDELVELRRLLLGARALLVALLGLARFLAEALVLAASSDRSRRGSSRRARPTRTSCATNTTRTKTMYAVALFQVMRRS